MEKYDKSKYDYLYENNKKYMDLIALSFGDRKITYEELHDKIEKYTKLLYTKGVRQGDRIGICAFNTPESTYLLYALDKLGATVIGYDPLEKKEKIRKQIELTKPKMVISVDMCYKNFRDWEKSLNFSTLLYSPMESIDDLKMIFQYKLLQLKNANFKLSKSKYLIPSANDLDDYEKALFDKNNVTDILFTGGSTGVPKGVELNDRGINSVVEGMESFFPSEPGMIHLGNIPFGHMAYGRLLLHYALCNNLEYALTIKGMPCDFYDEIVRTHANAAVGGPVHWTSLIEECSENENKYVPNSKIKKGSLTELHFATSGGEALKNSTRPAINDALRFGGSDAVLGDVLGATENNAAIMINNGKNSTPGTIGKPISTIDVKLVDTETNKEVLPGEKGTLFVSGPSVMLGYHNNPEETENVMIRDENGKEWINLGDILVETPYGEYKYVGREKRNFVSGCENIYPEQIESLLLKIPEIRELVVTPISDDLVQFIPRYHISLYDEDIDYKELEDKIYELITSEYSENWLPGSIEYYDKPLERMHNSKVNIAYYKELDRIALENNKINNVKAKQLRLKMM